jgi:hypothetical protein
LCDPAKGIWIAEECRTFQNKLAFRHIGQRLSDPEAPTGRLWNEKLDFISTVGELREAAQSLGPIPWFELQRAYHEAAGLKPKREQRPACADCPAAEAPGLPSTPPLLPLPPGAELEPGLHCALNDMPERVQAFLLHQQKPAPPWRYQESEAERAHRELLFQSERRSTNPQ